MPEPIEEQSGNLMTEERIEMPAESVPDETTDVGRLLGAPPSNWRQIGMQILAALIPVVIVVVAIVAIRPGGDLQKWLLVGVVVVALAFDYVNGMNDAANAIATVVSTRVLPPLIALLMAASLNFIGALVHTGVAKTIASIFANPQEATMTMILCGLIGAVIWSWLMTRFGLPVSVSHSLIGGLVGVALISSINLNVGKLQGIVLWIFLAPIIGLISGFLLMLLIMRIFHAAAPYKLNKHFRFWQMVSSASMAFTHGMNDAQKAMGAITLALVAAGIPVVADGDGYKVPLWVIIACATVIALGTGVGGWRVIRTLGHKMIKLMPVHGFAAETAAAGSILLATKFGMPVSTTHVITSSIMGVGASKRLSAVRWGVATNIVVAWVFTIPACGLASAALYALVRLCGMK
ncbi:MAG: Low-affinity inorganic phosphate transporter 1 [bacterium ADurb.Bin429]|nr:MAG: Low-affinity inorganic phosphate transporter 1 [bacterium ADurb.Bin429]